MRKCIRCGTDMLTGFSAISVKQNELLGGYVTIYDDTRLLIGRLGIQRVAICPKCGEISTYLGVNDLKKMREFRSKEK